MSKGDKIYVGLIILAIGIGISLLAWIFYSICFSPEKTLAEIDDTYDKYDFIYLLDIPNEQIDDCIHWALGKNWFAIKWNYRSLVFRDLHPELDANDFADSTEIHLFWRRVGKAYLESIIINK